jgi:RNA polymerase sigma-70 factor (ECF subfamily)
VLNLAMPWIFAAKKPPAVTGLDVRSIHEEHADFVWRSLLRLGVREADAQDLMQNVFLVVHRRLETFDGSAQMTTWLFGICRRVAAAHRRRAFMRYENGGELSEEEADGGASPDANVEAREARARLDEILSSLDADKRAVFVMFELDEISCDEIAELLGVPVGTVYSRLSAARKAFEAARGRLAARDASAKAMRGARP